jgi:hypothetical protein
LIEAGLSLVSATLPTQPGQMVANGARLASDPLGQEVLNLTTATGTQTVLAGPTILTVPQPNPPATAPNPTAQLFLVAQAAFSVGTIGAYGSLFAVPLPSG